MEELQKIAVELKSRIRDDSARTLRSITSEITATAEKIDIENLIGIFSVCLGNSLTQFHKTKACEYLCDEKEILEAIKNVLATVWSDKIRFMIQSRISRKLMLDLQRGTTHILNSLINKLLNSCRDCHRISYWEKNNQFSKSEHIHALQTLSSRLKKLYVDNGKSRAPQMWTVTEVRMETIHSEYDSVILDVDRETILRISSPGNEYFRVLIYNPPYLASPEHHDDVLESEIVVEFPCDYNDGLFYTALRPPGMSLSTKELEENIARCIDADPGQYGELISEQYACQLKRGRGRAWLRSDSTGLPCEIFCPIDQASTSPNASQLAESLAKSASKSRSDEIYSSYHETWPITSSVSRDACKFFLSSGSSVEAEVYRQLVVERINDGDITAALKLCCIGHQIPFSVDNMNHSNLSISDVHILGETFNRMLKLELYEQERCKFLSICDEWYKVLEPQGLMNIEQRELLREWISTRQYANTEDPVVSLIIRKCSMAKKEELERKQEEWRKFRIGEIERKN